MRAAALLALLLGACGGSDADRGPSTETIERLSTPPDREAEIDASIRLLPLTRADVAGAGLEGAGCTLLAGDMMLIVAVGEEAIVRRPDGLLRLAAAAPVDPTGGYFRGDGLAISIGRIDDAGEPTEEGMRWRVSVQITNRAVDMRREIEADWACGA